MMPRRRRSRSRSPTQDLEIRFTITTYPEGHYPALVHVIQCPPHIQILVQRFTVLNKYRFLDTRIRKVLVTLNIENIAGWPTRFGCVGDLTGESSLSVKLVSDPGSVVVINGRQTTTKTYRIRVPARVMERLAQAARASARIDEPDSDETVIYPPFDRHGGAQ